MTYLLGIDIGTSSVKATLVDAETAAITASANREYPVHQPEHGWAEQDPADWWTATVETVRAVLTNIVPEAVAAIGLSGQMHGTVCLDSAGQPLRPAIIWADSRSEAQVTDLLRRVAPDELARVAPGPPAVGFMASSLMWLTQHEPETMARLHTVLLPKDYIRLRMTGNSAAEISDAASSWLFDVQNGIWSGYLVDLCGLEAHYLPPICESATVVGTLTPEAAGPLELPPGIPVIGGCADQPAQAIGHGLIDPGMALVTIGSGGQAFVPLAAPRFDPQLRYYTFNHAVPGRWYAAAATLAAGLSLRWLRDLLGLRAARDAYARLSEMAANVNPGADGLIFLPYLAGERTPHRDPAASGLFLGLRLHHEPGHLVRAVMEGVAFSLATCLELTNAGQDIIASGGGAASPVWRQIQADIFNRSLHVAPRADHAPLGAALLAGVGSGVYSSIEAAVSRLPEPVEVVEPDPARAAFYAERREQFERLYERLAEDMHLLADHDFTG